MNGKGCGKVGFDFPGSSATVRDFHGTYREMIREVGDGLPAFVASLVPAVETPLTRGGNDGHGHDEN